MSLTDPNWPVPSGLTTAELVLRPITSDDVRRDFEAVVETRDWLRLWEQSDWPADGFTVDDNLEDLVGLEKRHSEHQAFTYTVVNADDSVTLGCVYVFDISAKFLAQSVVTALAADRWDDVEAVVYFWARLSEMEKGTDARLLDALRSWFRDEWKLSRVVFVTNEQFTQQVGMIERTDLVRKFELAEPGKPGTYLIYG